MNAQFTALLVINLLCVGNLAGQSVTLVQSEQPARPIEFAYQELTEALEDKHFDVQRAQSLDAAEGDYVIAASDASKNPAAPLLDPFDQSVPEAPESLFVRKFERDGQSVVLATGSDTRGVMYALLGVAERIRWISEASPEDPFQNIEDRQQSPYVPERALADYTMHKQVFQRQLHDPKYWRHLFSTMAKNRMDTFVLIFGYETNGYVAPPYPYFFDVPGYPDVKVVGLSDQEQQKNRRDLNRMIEIAHSHGVDVRLGIWDHIYRGGVQGSEEAAKKPLPGRVAGLNGSNLVPYTKAALRQMVDEFPEMDGIQFRMHWESGLTGKEAPDFWSEVYDTLLEARPNLAIDGRAKHVPDSIINMIVRKGVNFRLTTKYWAEQMGMPFHPTHIPRGNQYDDRHGYADLLFYPKKYPIHWRLWNSGTTRILLWGSPEYARRFAKSTHLYDGRGYEVSIPLATKMQGHPFDQEPFQLLNRPYRYYDYELERYWHFFQCFGRVGYNPQVSPRVWQNEFKGRFGKQAGPHLQKGLHAASKILPRIVASCFPYDHFPTTRGWFEKQRQHDLPEYAEAEASDIQLFQDYETAAALRVEGDFSPKVHPTETTRWLTKQARIVLGHVEKAQEVMEDNPSKELLSTITDLKILANLARYHARRPDAAIAYNLWEMTQDVTELDAAIRHEQEAINAWKKIVESAGDVYHDDLMMGLRSQGLSGHWKDELNKLKEGIKALKAKRHDLDLPEGENHPWIGHAPVRRAKPDKPVGVTATVKSERELRRVTLVYRNGYGPWRRTTMESIGPHRYRAQLPGDEVKPGLQYYIEALDAESFMERFPDEEAAGAIEVTVSDDREAPDVTHDPVRNAKPREPLVVRAKVTDPSGVQSVRLRYRSVNQMHDYRSLPMVLTDNGYYKATVPAHEVPSRYNFMYFIEVMDTQGNGAIWPDFEKRAPYIIVPLDREGTTSASSE